MRGATGKKVTHHLTYELLLTDGRILRTRLSQPPDTTAYGPALWAHILRDQLNVSPGDFWLCVREGRLPDRGSGPAATTGSIPAEVVALLINRVGLAESEVAGMTRAEAIARLNLFWAGSD